MTTSFKRTLATVLAGSLAGAGVMHDAQATLIGTEAVARAAAASPQQGPARTVEEARAHVQATLQRADVAQALTERGVRLADAQARVAAMTDDEAQLLAQQIDAAPAGGDILGTLVFLFVLLLVTDILGLTKIFPFTRPVR
jgi:Flp pilus assembly protein TadG